MHEIGNVQGMGIVPSKKFHLFWSETDSGCVHEDFLDRPPLEKRIEALLEDGVPVEDIHVVEGTYFRSVPRPPFELVPERPAVLVRG